MYVMISIALSCGMWLGVTSMHAEGKVCRRQPASHQVSVLGGVLPLGPAVWQRPLLDGPRMQVVQLPACTCCSQLVHLQGCSSEHRLRREVLHKNASLQSPDHPVMLSINIFNLWLEAGRLWLPLQLFHVRQELASAHCGLLDYMIDLLLLH